MSRISSAIHHRKILVKFSLVKFANSVLIRFMERLTGKVSISCLKSEPAQKARLQPLIASERGEVSLFPFMSILASLIGILTLLIALSMAANQKKEGMTQEEIERAKDHKSLELLVKKKKEDLESSKKDINEASLSVMEMEKLKALAIQLQNEMAKFSEARLLPEDQIKARIQILKDEKIAIEKEQPTFQKKIEELQAKVAQLKELPEPRESVKVIPPKLGSKLPRNLFFAECTSSGIILRGANDEQIPISLASLKAKSPEFTKFCNDAKKTGEDHMVLFLVRPGGVESYEWASASAILDYKVRVGKLPIPNTGGKLDLSGLRLKNL